MALLVGMAPLAHGGSVTLPYRIVRSSRPITATAPVPVIPVVRSSVFTHATDGSAPSFSELNSRGGEILECPGALPYLAIGVAALGSDAKTEKWFHVTPKADGVPKTTRVFNHLGDGKVILSAIAILCLSGGVHERDTSKLWIASVANATTWAQTIKMLTGKERPNQSPGKVVYHGPSSLTYDSFPSGHTTVATASAVVLGHQYPRFQVPLYLMAGCVGLGRIQGQYHWPSDVYWGAGVGYYGAWQALRHRSDIVTWRISR